MTMVMDRQRRTSSRSSARPPRLPKDRREGSGLLRRFLIASCLFVLLMMITAVIAVWIAWVTTPLPPEVPYLQTSVVTDANGKELKTFSNENRVPVKLGEVPPVVIQAVLDKEDHNYYEHHGIDPRGIARALYVDIRSGTTSQGGSTITQQYVKQVYVGTDRTLWRKFKEAILAVKLDQRESKDEVLERYLNTIYFGRGAYGVQTASQAYFNKDVKNLGLQEASYLSGLIRGPEITDAYKHPEYAKQQRALVLGTMVRYGHITPEQEAQINAIDLKKYVTAKASRPTATVSNARGSQYFVDYVEQILTKKYGEQMVQSGGLRVKTTLDSDLQSKAYDSVYGFLKPGEPAGALVSLDQNGYVKAMVGGREDENAYLNLATGKEGGGSGRQAGSTFKPFELASAIDRGACYKDTYPGPGKMVIPGWDSSGKAVENYGNEPFGNIDLIEATEHSVNTVYAQMVMDNGVSNLISMAKKAGVSSDLKSSPSLVLGSGEVSVIEMAEAYLTFSQGGVHVDSNPILEVKNADGETLERANPKRVRVMDENVANVVNKALQTVVKSGTGQAADNGINGNVAVAGKTGTTEDNGDAWFVGYTKSISTALWMGYPESSAKKMSNVRGQAVTGGSFPSQMWSSYMRVATQGDKGSQFDEPENCTSKKGVKSTTSSSSRPTTSTTSPGITATTAGNGLLDLDRNSPNDRPGRNGNGNGRRTTTTSTLLPPVTIQPPDFLGNRATRPGETGEPEGF
jgi:membrane peptidoglycan carboxypeptidase